MDSDITIKGADTLIEALKKIKESAEREVGLRAVSDGARQFIKLAKSAAPRRSGKLRKSFGYRINKKRVNEITVRVGIKRGKKYAFYAHMVEFGTKPHGIQTKKKVLSNSSDVYGASVEHPGITERPFFAPSLENGKGQILDAIKFRLASELIKRGRI